MYRHTRHRPRLYPGGPGITQPHRTLQHVRLLGDERAEPGDIGPELAATRAACVPTHLDATAGRRRPLLGRTGLSDPVTDPSSLTLELRADDVRAVMDAAGSHRAALLGISEGVAYS